MLEVDTSNDEKKLLVALTGSSEWAQAMIPYLSRLLEKKRLALESDAKDDDVIRGDIRRIRKLLELENDLRREKAATA